MSVDSKTEMSTVEKMVDAKVWMTDEKLVEH